MALKEMAKMKVDILRQKRKGAVMEQSMNTFVVRRRRRRVETNKREKRGVSMLAHKQYKKNINRLQDYTERIMTLELRKYNRDINAPNCYEDS